MILSIIFIFYCTPVYISLDKNILGDYELKIFCRRLFRVDNNKKDEIDKTDFLYNNFIYKSYTFKNKVLATKLQDRSFAFILALQALRVKPSLSIKLIA
jgi:hypothetical protein